MFDPYRSKLKGQEYKVKSIRRMVIALFHNFVEITFWYSVIVITVVKFSGGISQGWIDFITSSILCMTTFDRGVIEEISNNTIKVLTNVGTCEVISGLIMTLVALARFIGILPAVAELDE